MTLYLLRHAEAEDLAASDRARRLTPKGEAQAARVAKFCRERGILPELILSSPVTRALQTARLVHGELASADLLEVPWAACGMTPDTFLREIAAYKKFRSVMLVGHQPDLGWLAAEFLGVPNVGNLHVRKALLIGLEVTAWKAGGAKLEFFVPVKLM